LALVGAWRVVAPGEQRAVVLRLADELTLTRRCGTLDGSWRADTEGLFVGFAFAGSGRCTGRFTPTWLVRAVGYRTDGRDRLLLDRTGSPVARLTPVGHPGSVTLRPDVRNVMRAGAAVPVPLVPARADDLVGRWVPVGGAPRAFVRFRADWWWDGLDGCNGQGGRWTVGPGGEFVAVSGAQTLIGCLSTDVAGLLDRTSHVALQGSALVLLDTKGHRVARLVRAPATP
jgi:hypothetical protein